MRVDEQRTSLTFRPSSLPKAHSECIALGGNMLKKVVLAFALAAAGFASQSACCESPNRSCSYHKRFRRFGSAHSVLRPTTAL